MTKLKKAMSIALVALMLMSALPMQLFAATMNDPWASTNVNDNIFLDALKYTGYDTSYFINNGTFGSSVPNSALSGIGYSSPGASGLEKTSAGKPDLAAFKSKGMCCASYASYVYFNYLPNVKGYNMTDLAVPSNPHSPDSWHTACEKWVSSGNATKTTINGSTNPNASTNSNLSKLKNVAIGSILTFTDSDGYAHIGLYAGYKNGRYYQTQVGNSRGPEVNVIDNFQKNGYLVVEAAYTPNVTEPDYYGAVGVKKVDDAGNAVSGAKIGVYSDSSCTKLVTTLTTGSNGTATYGYSNGEYTLDEGTTYYFKETSAPTGYDLSTQIVSAKVVKEKVTYASTSIVDNRQGKITLTKYDDANTKLGSGYVFGIYSDKACTKQITTMTTNSNGVATSGWLSAGTYYVKETSIPSSDKTHKLNTTVYTVTVTKGGTTAVNSGKFVNDRMKGNATVTKTSEDGIVEGLTFRLYGTADIGTAVDMTAKTNSKGVATFSNVLVGTYTIEEVGTPSRYETPKSQTVTVKDGQTANVTFKNVLKTGSLKVVKSAEDNFVEGITFRLTGVSLSGETVDMTAVTDKDGVAMFNDVPVSGSTPYTVEEVDTATRYVIPDSQTTAVQWDNVNEVSFSNILKKFKVEVTKTDAETGTAQGDASLAGAVYGIYKGGKLIDTYTTDANGQFTTKEYICGDDWTIREISPSEGYLLDATVYPVGADASLYTIEHNTTSVGVTEQVVKGRIHLTKLAVNGKNELGVPEVGAVFTIRLKSTNELVATLTIGEDGTATSPLLPYGVYTVHLEKGWDGYKEVADFDVYISENSKTYSFILNDYIYASYIKVLKQDAETGKNIAYAGAGFQIYDADGKLVTMTVTYPNHETIDTFYTDNNGILITPMELNYGKYTLVEVKAPYGYVLDKTPVPFEVNADTIVEEDGIMVVKVVKYDYAQKGKITVTKEGEVFWNATQSGDGYELSYKTQGLAGAVYEIYAAEDIITPDGTVRVKKGTLVDTVTTGKDGKATSKALYLGKYSVIEVKAPEGFIINSEPHEVELVYGSQTETVVSTGTTFTNERQKVEITLTKVMEQNDTFGIGNNGEILNVRFGLYANEDIKAADGTIIPKDALIEAVQLTLNGTVKFSKDLPFGQYYVKEIATDEHYILNGTKYLVTFSYAGQETALVSLQVNNGSVINKLLYGSVEGLKTDEFGIPLQGAEFGLFLSADADTPVYTAVSDANGKFRFDNIPYGTWYVREITAPEGFLLNETVFPVTIKENGEVVKITVENKYIRGTITLTKVDKDYPDNKLTGATFNVYEDTNKNGIYDSADKLVGTLIETELGIYTSEALIYGRYFVKEVVAPVGFILDENVYSVFIETDGAVYAIDNDVSGCFINAPALGRLKIVKTSEDGNLQGFKFRVYGTDITGHYFDEVFVTDENGEILIENLRIGDYTVEEIDVPAQYIVPDSVTVTVERDKTSLVEVHNALKRGSVKVTKTAEDGLVEGVKFHLYGMSLAGIEVDEYAVTDENGIAIFENILISDLEGYILEEVDTAIRYLVPAEQVIAVEWNTVTDVEVYNELKHGNITLTKVDDEYRDMLLSGAEFEVYFDVNDNGIFEEDIDILVGVMTEIEKGVYLIENVRYGGYFIHEKTAPNHYIEDIGYYYVAVNEDGETAVAENVEGTGLFVNGIKRGNILIVKNSEDGKKEGFSFRITGFGINMVVTTDANGHALIENLRVDLEYRIEEISDEASAGYILPEPVTVTLLEDTTLEVKFFNALDVDVPNTDGMNTSYNMLNTAMMLMGLTSAAMFICFIGNKKKSKKSKTVSK